jgi:hypothetical protein
MPPPTADLEPYSAAETDALAREMTAAAYTVDLARPVASRSVRGKDGRRYDRITFRIVERLRGSGRTSFRLDGWLRPADTLPAGGLKPFRHKADGRPYTFWVPDRPRPEQPEHSCGDRQVLNAERGTTYLVFRDFAGRPSGPFWYAAVDQSAPDPWLAAVRGAARR